MDADGILPACLVCLEDVKHADPIWQCAGSNATSPGCYALLHLSCAQAWSRQQQQQQQQNQYSTLPPSTSSSSTPNPLTRGGSWCCPKCRREYTNNQSTTTLQYTCFCGKCVEPSLNPWNLPHSCGEECAVPNPVCGHPCMLLCHPGPHPPCPQMIVDAICFCGKEKKARRCGKQAFSCGKICGQRLQGRCDHLCAALCHEGEHPACIRLISTTCRCGGTSTAENIRCSTKDSFLCSTICGTLLSCGVHTCDTVCCDKSCKERPCPQAAIVKKCPCGKAVLDGTTEKGTMCGDGTLPPCGQTCDKLLTCGAHRCTERCHLGPCPHTCRASVERPCFCGRVTKTTLCGEPQFRCERRCLQMRSCGRHQCKRKCCSGGNMCAPCEEPCNKWLRCGNHRCTGTCHRGQCSPCPLTVKIACACGATAYHVPCGRESTAVPPPCQQQCLVPAVCRHGSKVPPHRCHFGACPGHPELHLPACPLPCAAVLSGCGHTCSAAVCHDDPPPAVAQYTPPLPPIAPGERDVSKKRLEQLNAEPPAVVASRTATEIIEKNQSLLRLYSACPPCEKQLERRCLGGHVNARQSCCTSAPFACESLCGRPLQCGNHTCAMACHDVSEQPCKEPCEQMCTVQRACTAHPCPAAGGKCHSGECGECSIEVTMPCYCGKTSIPFPCYKTTSGDGVSSAGELCCGKICSRQLSECPHLCAAPCHQGPCGAVHCEVEVTVRCSCKRLKKKIKCGEVAILLKKEKKEKGIGNSSSSSSGEGVVIDGKYDENTVLRLLPCDADCQRIVAANDVAASGSGKNEVISVSNDGSSARADSSVLRPAAQRKRMLQQERAAEAERREKEREEKRLAKVRQARVKLILQFVLLLCLFGVVLGGALLLRRVLRTVDQVAQKKWGQSDDDYDVVL